MIPFVSTNLVNYLISLSAGFAGLCSGLLGLFWGFTNLIVRGREMNDYEVLNFVERSTKIIRHLIRSAIFFIFASLLCASIYLMPNDNVTLLQGLGFDLAFLIFLGSSVLFFVGVFFMILTFRHIRGSIRYLSKRYKLVTLRR